MEFAAALSVKGGFIEAVDFGLIDFGFYLCCTTAAYNTLLWYTVSPVS